MNTRTLIWLAGALAVLAALAVVGQRQTVPVTALDGNSAFLPGLMDSLESVTTISIVGANNEPVATLSRGADGWTIGERGGYRADLTKVRHTLLSLAEAEILEPKTANPALHSRLGVAAVDAQDATGLAVTLSGPAAPVTIIVGDAAGDYRRYARRDGEDQSYLINRDPELGATAADWLDTAIIDLPAERVREVTVTHPDGETLHVFKESREQMNFTVEGIPDGRSLLYDSVANVMGSVLQNLTLEDVEPATESAMAPPITEFRTFDGLTVTVHGIKRDDTAWIGISATADPSSGADEPASAESEAGDATPARDPLQEAATINARLAGWRFRIPTYKYEQLTRRMADLLQAQS